MDLILAIFGQKSVWIALTVVIAAGGVCGSVFGWPTVLKVALDPRTWIAAVVFLGALALMDLRKQNQDLKQRLITLEHQDKAAADAAAAVNVKIDAISKQVAQSKAIATARQKAKPDEQVDAAMDAIAALPTR